MLHPATSTTTPTSATAPLATAKHARTHAARCVIHAHAPLRIIALADRAARPAGLYTALGLTPFAEQLPKLLPMLLALLASERTPRRGTSFAVLQARDGLGDNPSPCPAAATAECGLFSRASRQALSSFREALREHMHVIVPSLLTLLDLSFDAPSELKAEAIALLATLAAEHDVSTLAAPIVHTLVRSLDGPCKVCAARTRAREAATRHSPCASNSSRVLVACASLPARGQVETVRLLCILALRLDAPYLVYEPVVRAAMRRQLGARAVGLDCQTACHPLATLGSGPRGVPPLTSAVCAAARGGSQGPRGRAREL